MKHISSLTRKKREQARLKAGRLFRRGLSQAEIARKLKVTPAAVNYWHKDYKKHGTDGLKSKGHPGFESELTDAKRLLFKKAVIKGPEAYGFETNLWTLPRLTAVLKKISGFACSDVWTWNIVRDLGFSAKKPKVKAKERDERTIARWKTKTLPGLKKMGGQTWLLSGF